MSAGRLALAAVVVVATYKAILDRWAGADTTPVALTPRSLGPRR